MIPDKYRGNNKHYPQLVGKSSDEMEKTRVKKEVISVIDKMTLEQLKALKTLFS